MRFTLLENVYDDGGNERVHAFFQKAVRWIRESSPASKENWKKILAKRYSQYLVECGSSDALLESQCEDCDGECQTCFVKGESGMNLEQQFQEAFGPKSKPEVEDESGFTYIYSRNSRDGSWNQTEHSKLDEKIYWEEQKKEGKIITEAGNNLSLDEKFQAALAK